MILLQKARRSMLANKRAYIACIFLIMVGILMQTTMSIASGGLETAVAMFYKNNHLADTYASVKSMPISDISRLERIPGVAAAAGRYITELRAEVPGSDEVVTLRLIAAADAPVPLNSLDITGRAAAGKTELLINPKFMAAHQLQDGDELQIISKGKEFTFTLTGTAISPEYVYITKESTQMLPDEAGFGVGYITMEAMELLTGSEGVINSVVLQRDPTAAFTDVRDELEDQLRSYGLKELYDKEDLISYYFMDLELDSISMMATSIPFVFLLLAIIVLYLMMKRVIEQERPQIGTLKAFGYSNRQIVLHYLMYGAITGLIGGILGWILGYMLSGVYLEMFLEFFMLPGIDGGADMSGIFRALVLAVGCGILGAYAGVKKVIRLHPAEAMRPESPRTFRFDIIRCLGVMQNILTARGSMALRSISRSPIRSSFVVISIMFSFGIISLVGSFDGMVDKMILSRLRDIERYQVRLTLEQPQYYQQAISDARKLTSVTWAEGLLELPFQMSYRHLQKDVMLTGVPDQSVLYHIADTNTGEVYLPPDGSIIVSNGLADELQIKAGDRLRLSSDLLPADIELPVSAVVEQNMGSGSYIRLDFLSRLIGSADLATSIMLYTDDLVVLNEQVKSSRMITTIEDKEKTLGGYQAMMGMFTSVYFALQIMGTLVAFAIIYNTTTISLSERSREYATMRVLGLSVNEVAEIMNFEYAVLTVWGIILGIPFTGLLNNSLNLMMDTDLLSMPSSLPLSAYLSGVGCCVLAIILAGRSAARKIRHFDMVSVLKERE